MLARVFGPAVKFQSTKARTGHTLGAAGTIELIFTEMMLREKRAAASLRYEKASEEIPVAPLTGPVEISGHAAVSTSLAFGGSNTALAVRRLGPAQPEIPPREIYIAAFRSLSEGEPDRDALVQLCRQYGLRRPDRLTQLALCAADAVADKLAGGKDCALITVTAYGPGMTTCRVLADILDYPEDQILPTGFSHSVVNAAGSYIGTALNIHGPTFATVGFEDPFYEAAVLARTLLTRGRCSRVLITAADEISMIPNAVETLRQSQFPHRNEGACALLLSADPGENNRGRLELTGKCGTSERLLPCGVPADLPDRLNAAGPDTVIHLERLPVPQWKQP